MNYLTIGAAVFVAMVGQWVKSMKNVDTRIPVAVMGALGLVFYGLKSGWPAAFEWDAIDSWLNTAWPWAFALPGLASTIGLHPSLKTDVR